MSDLIKKALLVGLGATAVIEETVEEIVKNIAKRGDVTTEEAKKIACALVEEAKKDIESAHQKGVAGIERLLEELNIATRKEYEALEKRVTALEESCKEIK